MNYTVLFLQLALLAIAGSAFIRMVFPKKDRGWPGTKYREPKD